MNKSFLWKTTKEFKLKNKKSFISKILISFVCLSFFLILSNILYNYWNYYSDKLRDNHLNYNVLIQESTFLKEDKLKELQKKDKNIKWWYKQELVGYTFLEDINVKILAIEDIEKNISDIQLINGRMPQNEDEMIIPYSIVPYTHLNLNEYIEMNIGLFYENDNYIIQHHRSNYPKESLINKKTKKYKVVGVYKTINFNLLPTFYSLLNIKKIEKDSIINYAIFLKNPSDTWSYRKTLGEELIDNSLFKIDEEYNITLCTISDCTSSNDILSENKLTGNLSLSTLSIFAFILIIIMFVIVVFTYYFSLIQIETKNKDIYNSLYKNNFYEKEVKFISFLEGNIIYLISLIFGILFTIGLFKFLPFIIKSNTTLYLYLPLNINILYTFIIVLVLYVVMSIINVNISGNTFFNNTLNISQNKIKNSIKSKNILDHINNYNSIFETNNTKYIKLSIIFTLLLFVTFTTFFIAINYSYSTKSLLVEDEVEIVLNNEYLNDKTINDIRKLKSVTALEINKRYNDKIYITSEQMEVLMGKMKFGEEEKYYVNGQIYSIGEDFKKYSDKECIVVNVTGPILFKYLKDNADLRVYFDTTGDNYIDLNNCTYNSLNSLQNQRFHNIISDEPFIILREDLYEKYIQNESDKEYLNTILIKTESYLTFSKKFKEYSKKNDITVDYIVPKNDYLKYLITSKTFSIFGYIVTTLILILNLITMYTLNYSFVLENEKTYGILRILGANDKEIKYMINNKITKFLGKPIIISTLVALLISYIILYNFVTYEISFLVLMLPLLIIILYFILYKNLILLISSKLIKKVNYEKPINLIK